MSLTVEGYSVRYKVATRFPQHAPRCASRRRLRRLPALLLSLFSLLGPFSLAASGTATAQQPLAPDSDNAASMVQASARGPVREPAQDPVADAPDTTTAPQPQPQPQQTGIDAAASSGSRAQGDEDPLSDAAIAAAEARAAAEGGSIDLFRADPRIVPDPVAADIEILLDQGRNERLAGDFLQATRTLEDALERIEDDYGVWDQRNVSALTELGAVQAALGRVDAAVASYQQALHVNRINQGLHDVTQLGILDDLTELSVAIRDWEQANQFQEYGFRIQQREYGAGSPRLVPGIYRLANWYQRTGAVFQARALYEQAVAILEAAYGPTDVRLIDALQGIALTYRLERYPIATRAQRDQENAFTFSSGPRQGEIPLADARMTVNRYGAGESALARVVEIHDANPDALPREKAEALLDLGDWYLIFDKWSSAFEAYDRARVLLATDGWDEARVEGLFSEPTPLVFPLPDPPSPPAWASDRTERRGYIDLVYDVTDRGRVGDVDVVSAEPEGLMDFRTRKAIKAARFRPRFEAGEPVGTRDIQYRHSFVYYSQSEAGEG